MRGFPKEYRKRVRKLVHEGWRIRATKSGATLLAPDGEHAVAIHGTPSDRRAVSNFQADIRRAS
jgi:hypothetical protein